MMTNYDADEAPSPWSFLYPLWQRLWLTVQLFDWEPWRWAKNHDCAIDLPSAWYLACQMADCQDKIVRMAQKRLLRRLHELMMQAEKSENSDLD